MNLITHLMLSCSVRKVIRENMGVKLNLFGFMLGNILPDINFSFMSKPHYMEESFHHVQQWIGELKDQSENKNSYHSFTFAKDLGVINHYISDFFCFAHAFKDQISMRDHFIYETVMISKFKKGIRKFNRDFKNRLVSLSPEDIVSWVENKNAVYKEQQASTANDLGFAIFAGSVISECLVRHSVCHAGFESFLGYDEIGSAEMA